MAWFSCVSLIGRGCFIISRCTPSIIRRHRSLGVTKISDDSQTGCYRLWHLDLTLPWLRNKYCDLKNCTHDYVRVTFEPFVCNLGFIGFLWTCICNSRLNSCSVNNQIFIYFFPNVFIIYCRVYEIFTLFFKENIYIIYIALDFLLMQVKWQQRRRKKTPRGVSQAFQ